MPLFIQTLGGIILMLAAWMVILILPMLDEILFPLSFTLSELFSALIIAGIAAILVRFGMCMEFRLRYLMRSFPQAGTLVKQFVLLVVVLLLYFAIRPLAVPYMGDIEWLYHLLFLLGFLVILGLLTVFIYRDMEQLASIFINAKKASAPGSAGVSCRKCGENNISNGSFCSFCGEELPHFPTCLSCGILLKEEASFCSACGTAAGETAPPPPEPFCFSCQINLKPDAESCPSCGREAQPPPLENNVDIEAAKEEAAAASGYPFCVSCKEEVKQGVKFCPECGAEQVR